MSLYTVRQPHSSESQLIQDFLDNHWKKGHSLVKSKTLLDFQHLNKTKEEYNYIIAQNNETNEIDALFGFIPTYQYDAELNSNGDYWGAIWKKRDDIDNEEIGDIGMDVFTRLFEFQNFHSFAAIGISKMALRIYKAFKCKIGYLHHYYIFNNEVGSFKVAKNVDNSIIAPPDGYLEENGWRIIELGKNKLEDTNIKPVYRPYKSITYLKNRDSKHPYYEYHYMGIYKDDELITIWVYRKLNVNGAVVLRVVDALGEISGTLYFQLLQYMKQIGAEYLDFLNYGVPPETFRRMGFRELDFDGELILPNYYEPFAQCNVKIDIAVNADYEGYVAFKGDSDQDRPNVV